MLLAWPVFVLSLAPILDEDFCIILSVPIPLNMLLPLPTIIDDSINIVVVASEKVGGKEP